MAANVQDYIPLLISERVEPNDVGQFDLCRAASLLMGIDYATLGEFTTRSNGSRWGKGLIKSALEKMRKGTGAPLRGAYNQGHMDDFLLGIGFPVTAYQRFNWPMSDIKQKLKTHVIFLAGDVKHTPKGSPLRKYVNAYVGHEIILVKINSAGDRIAFIDPMTPHGTAKYLRWAPVSHFRAFASEFKEGNNLIAGTMRKGRYTKAKKMQRLVDILEGRIASKQETITQVRSANNDLGTRINELSSEVDLLETELASVPSVSAIALEALEVELSSAEERLDRIRAITLE